MNKAIAELSADNAVLISKISQVPRGTAISYETEFTEWLGRPIRNRADLSSFTTVEKKLRKDYDICLSVIPGVGYKVLTHSETLDNDTRIERARRAAATRKKELATVDLSVLNEQQKLSLVCKVTQAHLVEEAGKEKSLKKLALAANGKSEPLALASAFEALKGNV